MISAKYYIKGSASLPYEMVIKSENGKVSIACDCPAGKKATLCKHRIGLVTNTLNNLLVDQSDDLSVAAKLLDGTVYVDLLEKIKCLEVEKENIESNIASIKKQLTQHMKDGV